MTTVINVPQTLSDKTFETVLTALAPVAPDDRVLLDARHTRWASPYGLAALLTLAQTRTERPALYAPDPDIGSYWARTGFFRHAESLFELHGQIPRPRSGAESDVLLEITPVAGSEDVHEVVSRIQGKAHAILSKELNLEGKATMGFAMTLSEACQNIVEHAGRGGWVSVQMYRWEKRLGGRRVVVIAVCDAGIGFRQSLESGASPRSRDDRWDDAMALEDAVIRGVSRFRDPGRGQGLAGVRRYIGRWEGKLSVRSGTARISIVPEWDDDVPLQEKLARFPGAQIQITIPERGAVDQSH
ncbi:MAG: ATP-binding protein [Gemmatimonadaceae bacterium]